MLFALWIIGLIKKNTITKTIFRLLGVLTISVMITLRSLSSNPPILFSLSQENKHQNLITSHLMAFALGVILPFIITLLLSGLYYKKVAEKIWWHSIIKVLGVILILTSCLSIVFPI
jgi:cytochrome c biogenesis protein CcdA